MKAYNYIDFIRDLESRGYRRHYQDAWAAAIAAAFMRNAESRITTADMVKATRSTGLPGRLQSTII